MYGVLVFRRRKINDNYMNKSYTCILCLISINRMTIDQLSSLDRLLNKRSFNFEIIFKYLLAIYYSRRYCSSKHY